MLTALKPVDEAGQPVNRECIYEQCRFFNHEARDCNLMLASRAMLQVAADTLTRPAAPPPSPGGDLDRRLTEIGRDLLHSDLEVQGVVREAGQAALDRLTSLETRLAPLDRLASLEDRLGALDRLSALDRLPSAERLAALEDGLAPLRRLEGLEDRLAPLQHLEALDQRFAALEARLAAMEERLVARPDASSPEPALLGQIDALQQSMQQSLTALRASLEAHARSVTSRLDDHSRALGENGASAVQVETRLGSLNELNQKIAERVLEEVSLVSASAKKLDQSLQAVVKGFERTTQDNLHLTQLLTLIKGETERTYAALRSINEGNRTVLQAIETQLQRDQADLKRRRQEEAQTCNNRGVVAYYRGALQAAEEAFRQALKLQPEFAEAANNLGLVLSKTGRGKEATEAFQEALTIDPKMGEVYNNLGFLYHTTSQFERAAEMFGQAVQNAADSSVAYTNLGNCFYKMKQPDKAVEAWRRALELDPMNENARRGLRAFEQDPGRN
jgi:tetratricopeptide (TPR) repeat protein